MNGSKLLLVSLLVAMTFPVSSHFIADIDRDVWKTDEEIDRYYGTLAMTRGAESQRKALAEWATKLEEIQQMAPSDAIPLLGEAVFKLARFNVYQVKERVAIYDRAREQLLSIPGHAQYFADEVERMRAELKPGESPDDYDRWRYWYLKQTLEHLPSPETIRVLGHYLSDDRDAPPSLMVVGSTPANSMYASEALAGIGLRNAPVAKGKARKSEDALAKHREWYERVRSGELAFSFVGQKVEYRFLPDGAVEEKPITPPVDEMNEISMLESPVTGRTESGPTTDPEDEDLAGAGPVWPWLAAGGVILAVAGWLAFRAKP